jgi:cytoskeletal protein CcmA (bactofilin family)
MQVDGVIDGQVHVEKTLIVSRSGRVTGEIYAGKIIVNGIVDGSCYASSIEILENGSVTGTIYTDDLCIERGGKFKGDTHPAVKDEVIEIVKESDKPKLDQKAKEKQA